MLRPLITIHNSQTDEIQTREMNDEEFAQWEIDQEAKAIIEAEAEAKTAQRIALLNKLGITEDEAKLLFGGN